jgi:SOS-response transcriptional repressor LexA
VKESHPGHIVPTAISGQAVVKKHLRQKKGMIMRSSNPRYTDIEVKETDQFAIAGVVLRIVEGAL